MEAAQCTDCQATVTLAEQEFLPWIDAAGSTRCAGTTNWHRLYTTDATRLWREFYLDTGHVSKHDVNKEGAR